MTEDEIIASLKDGSIKLNQTLLTRFKNSMLICDEIHDTYNSLKKNNWGIAIQIIMYYYPNLKTLFLSATPINNDPSEIVDICNYKNPVEKRVYKKDLFKDKKLLPNALDKIYELTKYKFENDKSRSKFLSKGL